MSDDINELDGIIGRLDQAAKAAHTAALVEFRALLKRDWQPIETAPKDETVVLLFCPDSRDSGGMRVGWWYAAEDGDDSSGWYDDETASHRLTDLYGQPTHWLALPESPQITPKVKA